MDPVENPFVNLLIDFGKSSVLYDRSITRQDVNRLSTHLQQVIKH